MSTDSNVDYPEFCTFTGLKNWELDILNSSWLELVGEDNSRRAETATSLVLWLFDNIPNMQQRLSNKIPMSSHRSLLISDKMFLSHSFKLIGGLERLVHASRDPKQLEREMKHLIRIHTHSKPPVGDQYFKHFRREFHVFLQERFKAQGDDERIRIWQVLVDKFCDLIHEGELHVIKREQEKRGCCCVQ
ncbi:globin-like [Physella acuta]|uniref:globin-like n=1 Tax=Physella acuta TaxID=109671 RepID=UPI0027DBD035|nr:globin-like [Physella acuta]